MRLDVRVAFALLAALALLLSGCETPSRAQTPPPGAQSSDPARRVRVVHAEEGTLTTTRNATVRIEHARESNVAAGTSGRVAQILVREGGRVTEGETVIVLDDAEVQRQLRNAELNLEAARINLRSAELGTREGDAQLDAQLRAARANAESARRQYQEGQALYAAGGISQSDLLALEAQVAQAEAALAQAEAAVQRSQRAEQEDLALLRVQLAQAEETLRQARDALQETRIRAPFAGEVGSLYVREGEFIGAGSPAFRLIDSKRQLARFSVPPAEAEALRAQGLIHLPYGGLHYAAQITRYQPPSPGEPLAQLTAEIYPSQTRIPAGVTLAYTYEVELARGVILPVGAVYAEGGRSYLYLAQDGLARRAEVTVLAEAGGQAVLDGISVGSLVIHPRPLDLRDGTRIEVVDD